MEKRVCTRMILTALEEPLDGMVLHEEQVNGKIIELWEEGWAVTDVGYTKILMGHAFTQVDFIEKTKPATTRPLEVS